MRKINNLLLIVILTTACASRVCNTNDMSEGSYRKLNLYLTDTLTFPLDSITSSMTLMSQKFKDYYTFLSFSHPKRIHFYNEVEQKLVYSLHVDDLDYNVSGYFIQSLDSIFLFSYENNTITMINSQEKILDRWELPPFGQDYLNAPKVMTGRPLLIKNGKLYSGGIGTGEPPVNQKIITEIDTDTKKVKTHLEYPYPYNRSNWGGSYFRYVYFTKSLDDNFLISFPASHLIYETNNFEELISHYGGSLKIKSINSLNGALSKEKRVAHYQTNYSYRSIITDPYRNVYYRIYEEPIEFTESAPWYKPCGAIVLDENFEYIGEFDLKIENISPSWHYSAFVSQKGLCVQINSDKEEKDMRFVALIFN